MPIRLVTLDCAGTLLEGTWDPLGFALWAAREAGLCLPKRAREVYGALLSRRYDEVLAANLTGDPAVVREAYISLGAEWLAALDVAPHLATEVVEASNRLLHNPGSGLFTPYADVVPTLVALRQRDLQLIVVSNWDVSLATVLKAHGLLELVDGAFASLVVGAEKPHPKMLLLAMASAGVRPDETLHVGDDEVDDLGAAKNAGTKCLLLQRPRITLQDVYQWID